MRSGKATQNGRRGTPTTRRNSFRILHPMNSREEFLGADWPVLLFVNFVRRGLLKVDFPVFYTVGVKQFLQSVWNSRGNDNEPGIVPA